MKQNESGPATSEIKIKLGQKHAQRLQQVSEIKNAMTCAIMMLIENDMMLEGKTNKNFEWFQTFYLEADTIENYLKKI